MLKIIAIAAALGLSSAAYAQNSQGAGSSGAAPQVSNPSEAKDSGGKATSAHSMKKDKAPASQGTTTGSSGSKAGTSTSK